TAESAEPVLFSTLIILVAFIPLFTMQGVPGRIFAPMSVTYGFAMTGALIFALFFAPVLASYRRSVRSGHAADTRLVHWMKHHYERLLIRVMWNRRFVLPIVVLFLLSLSLFWAIGREFMPKLEEGNLWIRTTLPQDVSFEYAARLDDEMRGILRSLPEVKQVVSQVGRPDDGTDTTTFNNIEFQIDLNPQSEWKTADSKDELIQKMDEALKRYPGVA